MSNMSNNNYYLNRHDFNLSSRATFANVHPSTANLLYLFSQKIMAIQPQSHSIALIRLIILITRNS